MFKFEANEMYQMPVHFGPACGPRRGPDGRRFCWNGPQDSLQHSLVYETNPNAIEAFLPQGFSLRQPYVIVTHKMHRNLPWLAGRGYNVVTFNTPVFYQGKEERVLGQYQLAIWESHADPILSGREQLGYAKVFADIEDMRSFHSIAQASLSSWGFRFLELQIDKSSEPGDLALLQSVLLDPESEGLLHYKYIPRTGDGFCEADVAYVTISPRKDSLPEGLPPLPPPERSWCSGNLTWHIPTWEDMPTQYHIVQGLASLPVLRVFGGSVVRLQLYGDVYGQRRVR